MRTLTRHYRGPSGGGNTPYRDPLTAADWSAALPDLTRRADGTLEGPCPVCGPGESRSRFRVHLDGRVFCRSCCPDGSAASIRALQEIEALVFPNRRREAWRDLSPQERRERDRKREQARLEAERLRQERAHAPTDGTPLAKMYLDGRTKSANTPDGAPALAYLVKRGTWTEADGALPSGIGWCPRNASPWWRRGDPDSRDLRHVANAGGAVIYAFRDLPLGRRTDQERGPAVSVWPIDPNGDRAPFPPGRAGGNPTKALSRGSTRARVFAVAADWWEAVKPNPWPAPDAVVLLEGPADALAVARLRLPGVEVRASVTKVRAVHAADVERGRVVVVGDSDDPDNAAKVAAELDALRVASPATPPPGKAAWKDPDDWLRGCDPDAAAALFASFIESGNEPVVAVRRLLRMAATDTLTAPPQNAGETAHSGAVIDFPAPPGTQVPPAPSTAPHGAPVDDDPPFDADGLSADYEPPLPPAHGRMVAADPAPAADAAQDPRYAAAEQYLDRCEAGAPREQAHRQAYGAAHVERPQTADPDALLDAGGKSALDVHHEYMSRLTDAQAVTFATVMRMTGGNAAQARAAVKDGLAITEATLWRADDPEWGGGARTWWAEFWRHHPPHYPDDVGAQEPPA